MERGDDAKIGRHRPLYKSLRAPFTVQIELSARCPNECFHCYNFWRNDNDNQNLACTDMALGNVVTVMDEVIANGVFHIVLTGGEPLLNKPAVFIALEKAAGAGLTVSLNSTLIQLTRQDALRMRQFKLRSVLTSILGPEASVHNSITQRAGSFAKTVRGIRILQDAGIRVNVNMVITQVNKHLVKETAHFVRSLGVKSFFATRAGCPGNCGDFSPFALDFAEFKSYLNDLYVAGQVEKLKVGALESYPLCGMKDVQQHDGIVGRRCLAGVMSCTIGVDGVVRPCSHLDVQYGNVLQGGLRSAWSSMSDWQESQYLPALCRSCKLLALCGGGCRMEAKMRNGGLDAMDPYAAPSNVAYINEKLISQTSAQKPAMLPALLRVNPEVRWREEDFGVAIFVGSQFETFINNNAFVLLRRLGKDEIFATADLVQSTADARIGSLLGKLYLSRVFVQQAA